MSTGKKRGRKPKNNIIINNNPVFDNSCRLDNLIIRLKINENENDNISDNLECYESIDEYLSFNSNKTDNGIHCWNCCYEINGLTFGLPIKYEKNIFYTIGHFCSLNCCGRYSYDNYSGQELYNILSNLNFFLNKWKKTRNECIKIPPIKYVLKKFGGKIDIEDYRSSKNNDYFNTFPPIVPITSDIHFYETKINESNKSSDLKLYRKKPMKNKNNIFSTMNIEKEPDLNI